MEVLVFGGAGYIASHTCMRLSESGYTPIVFDNLSNGHKDFVKWGPLYVGDIRDIEHIRTVMAKHSISGVLNFAGLIEVGQSFKDPIDYYEVNVSGNINIIRAMNEFNIRNLVFSSTCATYGKPSGDVIFEDDHQRPESPYARTKLAAEMAILDACQGSQLNAVILRYFNAAGADLQTRIGERHNPESHAIPIMIQAALGLRDDFKIYGTDYDTFDGTCIRDYVHVIDLADAHVAALQHLMHGGATTTINLGTGVGTSVKQLIESINNTSGMPLKVIETPRRNGDVPSLVANNERAKRVLGWHPRYTLDDIIRSAWKWHHCEVGNDDKDSLKSC